MTEEHLEIIAEYLYWIGYSLDRIAARAHADMPEGVAATLLQQRPEPPPPPTIKEEREFMSERRCPHARHRRWRPV